MSRQSQVPATGAPRTFGGGYFFGIPVGDLGWFSSLLIGLALGFLAFFIATFCAIFTVLFLNSFAHQSLDYALTYRRIGLPIGIVVAILALSYLGTLWVRRQLRRA